MKIKGINISFYVIAGHFFIFVLNILKMKQFILTVILTAFFLPLVAQTIDTRRKIEVMGNAEMEIVPDIIYVTISLQEYFNGNKKAADINELEKQLQNAVVKAGIPKENLMVNNVSSYNYTWEKKKNPNFVASKQYRLKLSDISKFNEVIAPIDPKAIQYTNIESYEHSKIAEFKKDLRKKALQAAQEKAGYLAETLNDKVGDALEINVVDTDRNPVQPMYANKTVMYDAQDAAASAPADIAFHTIKLNAQVRVVFELQ
jgi:uncharacterized protein YggE